ncbi:uncharacterized protein BKCO1_19000133 [Diplodia corticola]|uniref:Uncharacterized protein n=1 Tax=Diplodia corticola TaxID=236234 RepID=A0A1J9R2Z4_9PEZI|nr:uncharacterized protein BKCO1_19000133 [Diplodia corticola]OJD34945.1 hypothetical protein BKCO1_19000133 [Diplodia corticola]
MATQDQDMHDVTGDTTQNTTQDVPNPERINVRVAIDVTKGDEKNRYWQSLNIAFPETYFDLCEELRLSHWRVQAVRQEWGYRESQPFVCWADVPRQTAMNADNWASNLRLMCQRRKGDYIRLDSTYSLGAAA